MYMHSYQNSSSDIKLMNCFVCSNLWDCYKCIILEDCYKIIFKCIHLYNIRNYFSVLYCLCLLRITETENFTEIFH